MYVDRGRLTEKDNLKVLMALKLEGNKSNSPYRKLEESRKKLRTKRLEK